MKNAEYFGILGTVWIASYKPDAVNLTVGGVMLILALLMFFAERSK